MVVGVMVDSVNATYTREDDHQRPANVRTQREFLMDSQGNIPKIRIYRYEDIGALFAAIETDVGRKLLVENLNQSPKRAAGHFSIDLNRPGIRSEYDLYNKFEGINYTEVYSN